MVRGCKQPTRYCLKAQTCRKFANAANKHQPHNQRNAYASNVAAFCLVSGLFRRLTQPIGTTPLTAEAL